MPVSVTRMLCVALLILLAGGCSRTNKPSTHREGELDQPTATSRAPMKRGGRTVIQNKGSDTLVNVAQAWAEAYRSVDPSVAIAVTGGGSGTGISALLNGTVDLANSSRKLKDRELKLAQSKGIQPLEHIVGYDALAIFVHKDNPLRETTFEQLAQIYGEGGNLTKWSQLGVRLARCQSDEIIRISRQNNSGTFSYFKDAILGDREFKLGSRDLHGSKDVVDLVAKTPCAIGYSGIAYATPDVVMPCIKAGKRCIAPNAETAQDRSYPIARPLIMYTNGQPQGVVAKYLDWLKSDRGQCILQRKGYAPARKVSCD